jgi:hypothetical protein
MSPPSESQRYGSLPLYGPYHQRLVLNIVSNNLHKTYDRVNGLLVGRTCKKAGKAENLVEEARVKAFTETMRAWAKLPGPGPATKVLDSVVPTP